MRYIKTGREYGGRKDMRQKVVREDRHVGGRRDRNTRNHNTTFRIKTGSYFVRHHITFRTPQLHNVPYLNLACFSLGTLGKRKCLGDESSVNENICTLTVYL